MRTYPIPIPRAEIARICQRRRIRRLSLFGSVLRDDFTPESDVVILVEFEPGQTPGLGYFDIQEDLSGLFGRKVDLLTPAALSKYLRDRVLASAEPLPFMSQREDRDHW